MSNKPAIDIRSLEGIHPNLIEDLVAEGAVIQYEQAADSVWAVEGGCFFRAPSEFTKRLESGVYTFVRGSTFSPPHFRSMNFCTDEIVPLKGDAGAEVLKEIQNFWGARERYKGAGLLWKRGILLWGPPGTGKSAIVQVIMRWLMDNDGVAINIDGSRDEEAHLLECLQMFRRVEPTRPVVIILEEIDRCGEGPLLPILDGSNQFENVVYLATTNYPERLSTRLLNRPSRFDRIIMVDFPSSEARAEFIEQKCPEVVADNAVKQWVKVTEGMSIAHIKELYISVYILDIPFQEALWRINMMRASSPDSNQWQAELDRQRKQLSESLGNSVEKKSKSKER